MATLRDLRKRVKSVRSTEKITKAMKMVAASKLRRAQNAILEARPYALRMDEVLQHIVNTSESKVHPLLSYRVPRRVAVVVMSSDRGLCGGFNSNILRSADRFLAENASTYEHISISTLGRKAADHFKRKGVEAHAYEDVWSNLQFEAASEMSVDLAARFEKGELDAVYILYNQFKSAIAQNLTLQQLLPVRPLDGWEDKAAVKIGELAAFSGDTRAVAGRDGDLETDVATGPAWPVGEELDADHHGFSHVFEPSQDDVLNTLVPQHLAVQIYRAMLESVAAEHGARMSAMDAASRNAKELIDKLTLRMNRVRQATITTELMEIVSGAESLKQQ